MENNNNNNPPYDLFADLSTLFFVHRPNGDSKLMMEARLRLMHNKVIRNVGLPNLCTALCSPREIYNRVKDDPAKSLMFMGACVMPLINEDEDFKKATLLFEDSLLSFREYRRDNDKLEYFPGGKFPFGNPSSFHNGFSRAMRLASYNKAREVLETICAQQPDQKIRWRFIRALYDRMLVRGRKKYSNAETWHRDVADNCDAFDMVFGGWINVTEHDQVFSYIPGSHLGLYVSEIASGFATVQKYCENAGLQSGAIDNVMKELEKARIQIKIPKGHMIIFPQHIMHEIHSVTLDYELRRQFIGFQLTRSPKSIYIEKKKAEAPNAKRKSTKNTDSAPKKFKAEEDEDTDDEYVKEEEEEADESTEEKKEQAAESDYYHLKEAEGDDILDDIISKQGIAKLPGSMMPPMYHARQWQWHNKLVKQWCKDSIIPELLNPKTGAVPQYMKSLEELGLSKYADYTKEEIDILKGLPEIGAKQ